MRGFAGPFIPSHVVTNRGHRYLVWAHFVGHAANLYSEREHASVDAGTQWVWDTVRGRLFLNGHWEKRAKIEPLT